MISLTVLISSVKLSLLYHTWCNRLTIFLRDSDFDSNISQVCACFGLLTSLLLMASSSSLSSFVNHLNIMQWNCRGIFHKCDELLCSSYCFDVLALSETYLSPHHSFALKSFYIIRADSIASRSRGLALAIRNNLPFKQFILPFTLHCSLEALWISILSSKSDSNCFSLSSLQLLHFY